MVSVWMREVWVITDNTPTYRALSQAWHAATCTYTSTTSGISCTFWTLAQKDDACSVQTQRECFQVHTLNKHPLILWLIYLINLANLVSSCPFPVLIWIRVQCPSQKSSRKLSAGWNFFFCKSKYLNPGPQMNDSVCPFALELPCFRAHSLYETRGGQHIRCDGWDSAIYLSFPFTIIAAKSTHQNPRWPKWKLQSQSVQFTRTAVRDGWTGTAWKSRRPFFCCCFFFQSRSQWIRRSGQDATHCWVRKPSDERGRETKRERMISLLGNTVTCGTVQQFIFVLLFFFFSLKKKSQTEPTYLDLR